MESSLPCLCTMLRKASRAVTRLYDERLAQSGMTITQFAILRNLAREGTLPLSRLADLMVMERTSLYRTIAPLEAQNWVLIAAGTQGRIKAASITPAGQAALQRATEAWDETQQRLIGAIGRPAWQALETQLTHLIDTTRGKTI